MTATTTNAGHFYGCPFYAAAPVGTRSPLSDLEEAVIRAVRDGKDGGEVRTEVEGALRMALNLKAARDTWGRRSVA